MPRVGNGACTFAPRWFMDDAEIRAIADTAIRHSSRQAIHVPVGVDVRVVLLYGRRGARLVRPRVVCEPGTCRSGVIRWLFSCRDLLRAFDCACQAHNYCARALIFDFLMNLTQFQNRFSSAIRTFLFTRNASLSNSQFLLRLFVIFPIIYLRSVRKVSEIFDSNINADLFPCFRQRLKECQGNFVRIAVT